jgi:Ion transport protein/Cyclic nucleotide-binding domain
LSELPSPAPPEPGAVAPGPSEAPSQPLAKHLLERLPWERVPLVHESSRGRLAWDLWIAVLILTTAVVVPFQVAFRHSVSGGGSLLIYLIDLFFLVDLALNFVTSYRRAGLEITDRRTTSEHYLRTMFAIDLAANLPLDALVLALGMGREVGPAAVSAVLLLRLPRLLRVVRLFVILRRYQQQSWTNTGALGIVKFLVVAALLIHWVACGWFVIAYLDGFPADSWVAGEQLEHAASGTRYLRSLYWSIVTMTTVGYGDISPHRDIEYVYSIAVMLLGASLYAFIIGNLASLFSSLDQAKATFWNRIEALELYLRSRNVPRELAEQVHNYYEYIWARHRGIKADALLDDLPGPMRLEVLLHVTHELVAKVPLFHHCSPTLRNVLLLSLHAQTYAPGGYIVREGEIGREIFFISRGRMEIITEGGDNAHGVFEDGDYFGDLSLLLGERRTASVKALSYCELFVLEERSFNEIRKEYPEFREVLKKMSSEKTEKVSALVMAGIVL